MRENRVPIMLTDDELNDIDNWRYENRIATRSEAIRRLVAMSMVREIALAKIIKRSGETHA
ncbi:hypothetical protein FGI60_26025 [Brucella haematophila]|uniref:Ribbon-helix-helix protein CopG domain-containing protein n=1 Tax=Brucella haematophila TaxID=419474 RepID=A0ABX1DKL7_9HYPH|nr:hypothetical protein [Brucella haematophila]NKC03316.1 hypothetical protein [Brucella haematophila]TMU84704.1 hypothetical protein FGI60_26025 [Brucella haematophila]